MTMRQIDLDDSSSMTVVTGDQAIDVGGDIAVSVDADGEGIMVGLTAAQAKQLIGELTVALLEIGA